MRWFQGGWVSGLLASTALAVWPGGALLAKDVEPGKTVQVAQAQGRMEFAIGVQPLDQALTAFSAQTRIQVLAKSEATRGMQSAAVSGTYAPDEALRLMLAGTGITARFTDARTAVLERVAANGAMVLDPVTVEGASQQAQETAWGAVIGYVAGKSASGTKTDTPIVETPQTISVITREEMSSRGAQSVSEALRYTAGVGVEQYGIEPRGGYNWISIRGFTGQSNFDYQDGLRIASGIQAMFNTDPYGLERLEVVKGPASVLFGQNSPGGMILRVSKRPTEETVGEVEIQYGQYDRYQGAFDVGGKVNGDKRFLFRLTGVARDADTQFEYPNGDRVEDDHLFLAPAVTWAPNEDTRLTLLASAMRDRAENYVTFTRADGTPTHIVVGDPQYNNFESEQIAAGYELEHRFSDTATARQKVRFGRLDLDYRALQSAGLQADGHTLNRNARYFDESLDYVALDNQGEIRFRTGPLAHIALAGVDFQRSVDDFKRYQGAAPSLDVNNPVYGLSIATPTTLNASQKTTQEQLGIYGQDQIKFDDKWILTAGLRHDQAETLIEDRRFGATAKPKDSATTWRAGLTFLSETGLAPYLSYSESFLPLAETGRTGDPFKPTTAQQYEAGLKYQPKGYNSLITASLYQITQQNVPTTDPVDTNYNVQTGEIRSQGLELEAKASLTEGLDLTASYTNQDVEVTKSNGDDLGKRPMMVPRQMASVWVDYTLQQETLTGLGFGTGLRYVGSTYGDLANTAKNGAYTLVDAAVHYDLDEWRFAINATNLFDREYIATCSWGNCYWGLGRTVVASMRYRW